MYKSLPRMGRWTVLLLMLQFLLFPVSHGQDNYPPRIRGAEVEVYKQAQKRIHPPEVGNYV